VFLVGYFLLKPDIMVYKGCFGKEPSIPDTKENRALRITTT